MRLIDNLFLWIILPASVLLSLVFTMVVANAVINIRVDMLELLERQVQELQQQEQVDVFQDYEDYEVELNTMAREPREE